MNHIKRLQEEKRNLLATIEKMEDEMASMRKYIFMPKFHCPDDWIRCWEIDDFIGRLRDIVTESARDIMERETIKCAMTQVYSEMERSKDA